MSKTVLLNGKWLQTDRASFREGALVWMAGFTRSAKVRVTVRPKDAPRAAAVTVPLGGEVAVEDGQIYEVG